MSADPPTDAELGGVVESLYQEGSIAELDRRPYPFATSFPLEELTITFIDGRRENLIFKDISWDRLLPAAIDTKPAFLHEPRRSRELYRQVLGPAGIGPRVRGSSSRDGGGVWLFLVKVDGIELWQVGEIEVWEGVARWLARFHQRFGDRVDELRRRDLHLLEYDDDWFRLWQRRALHALGETEDDRAARLRDLVVELDTNDDPLSPPTLIHGELYPSNVLVGGHERSEIAPIDWEMAGVGPPLVDLAALVAGWPEPDQRRLVEAYRSVVGELGHDAEGEEMWRQLERARLHLALRWLGWSPDWRPPSEHAHDWLGEALGIVERW